jgi:hypothetical protein
MSSVSAPADTYPVRRVESWGLALSGIEFAHDAESARVEQSRANRRTPAWVSTRSTVVAT